MENTEDKVIMAYSMAHLNIIHRVTIHPKKRSQLKLGFNCWETEGGDGCRMGETGREYA